MRKLLDTDACAVQGSTFIRNTRGWRVSALARMVDAEFFVTHFIYFPATEALASTGYFGGSNCLWRTAVLSQYSFDNAMLTEDIDLSARALLDGQTIVFCPEARSGELSPAGTRALVAQRLRWFMGWEQVTTKYCTLPPRSRPLTRPRRCAPALTRPCLCPPGDHRPPPVSGRRRLEGLHE